MILIVLSFLIVMMMIIIISISSSMGFSLVLDRITIVYSSSSSS